jgi:hydroxyacylglutathione hydrolase
MPSVTPGISQGGLEIVTIPCLSDNYAYLVKGPDGVCLIDAPEAGPIIDALEARGWTLGTILITHHHHDHVGGVEDLRRRYGCEVMGPEAERDKLPPIDMGLKDGDAGGEGPARTVAIAVSRPHAGTSGLPLPRGGCRLHRRQPHGAGLRAGVRGYAPMMWESLSKLAALPPETLVCSGHEYTQSNARFALTIEPDNAALVARAKDRRRPRRGPAHRSDDTGRGTGDQSVPARGLAGDEGGPRYAVGGRRRRVRGNSSAQGQVLKVRIRPGNAACRALPVFWAAASETNGLCLNAAGAPEFVQK